MGTVGVDRDDECGAFAYSEPANRYPWRQVDADQIRQHLTKRLTGCVLCSVLEKVDI